MENAYFAGIEKKRRAYENRRVEHQLKKVKIADTYGWESLEMKAWYEEEDAMESPIKDGENKACMAYKKSRIHSSSELELDDCIMGQDVEDFLEALRKAGIPEFAYTNQGSAAILNIHAFVEAGCTFEGLCKVTRREDGCGKEMTTEYPGVRFKVN